MSGILAIDTSTEACSVALYQQGEYRECFEIIPRQHNQRLFAMLRELLPNGNLREQGVHAIAYGCGPGSFTGLRIAASAVQGLAFANDLPCIPVSTLLCLSQGALRQGLVEEGDTLLSTLDARINEVYYALVEFEDSLATMRQAPRACQPGQLSVGDNTAPLQGIGSGMRYQPEMPGEIQVRLGKVVSDQLPSARDLVPLAIDALRRGHTQSASAVSPVYVRDEINWKKIAEQGKAAG